MTANQMPVGGHRAGSPTQPPCRVLEQQRGWHRLSAGANTVWLKGHLFGDGQDRIMKACAHGVSALQQVLPDLDGFFGLIVAGRDFAFAAADKVGSIPVFLARNQAAGRVEWLAGGNALALAREAGLKSVDPLAALSLGMAGYTIGTAALLDGLRHLRSGECAVVDSDGRAEFRSWSNYRPWLVEERPLPILESQLAEILEQVLRKLIVSAEGRCIAVPLSAGLDSRLIAAGLKHLGYRDVRTYAYGIPGNHEAEMSRRIAEHLGLPWTFVPATPSTQSEFFSSKECRSFVEFADTLTAIPFQQDYDVTRRILDSGYLPRHAIFVNGQSGDFITGNHVPSSLWEPSETQDVEQRWARILSAVSTKHFSLWRFLDSPSNRQVVWRELRADAERQGGLPQDRSLDWAVYESSEFIHRQSRYVIAGQRCYEHLDCDWRLPLWDRLLVDFYERVPLTAKKSQNLYRTVLRKLNWGGVWNDSMPVNRRNIRPLWIQPLRLGAKIFAAPLGRASWHRLERRVFGWWMDPVANHAVVSWHRAVRDNRGARNGVSWHAEAYLRRHGIKLEELAGRWAP